MGDPVHSINFNEHHEHKLVREQTRIVLLNHYTIYMVQSLSLYDPAQIASSSTLVSSINCTEKKAKARAKL